MAPALGTAAASASSTAVVGDALRAAGMTPSGSDGRFSVAAEGVDATVLAVEHVVTGSGSAERFLLPTAAGTDDITVHVVVFAAPAGDAAGIALVVAEETLTETCRRDGDAWVVTVTPAVSDTPELPLDVCVVPVGEIGAWVRAEIAECADPGD